MKTTSKYACVLAAALSLAACTDDKYAATIPDPVMPEDQALLDYLATFDVLKSYVGEGGLALGATVDPAEFLKREQNFSTIYTNFTEVMPVGSYMHSTSVADNGDIDLGNLAELASLCKEKEMALYGPSLLSCAGQNVTYLNALIAPVVIPYVPVEPEKGVIMVADFEADEIGKTYPMSNGSVAAVADDPDGVSGHVLHIGEDGNGAAYSYPEFEVELTEGVTLGVCKGVRIDLKAPGSGGLYGQGLRLYICDATGNYIEHTYGNCQSFGCADNQWGRNLIMLDINQANLSAADKEMTKVKFRVGSATGSGNYYIDNIRMEWEIAGDDTGRDVLVDFENCKPGDKFPMTGNSTAVVEADPDGKSGNVLHIGSDAEPANQSHPTFHIVLPDGHKLGDYKSLSVDFRGDGSTGLYGSGVRLGINTTTDFRVLAGPSGFGCMGGNVWNRNGILIMFDGSAAEANQNVELTAAEKELTEFDLTIGSGTGSGNYWIDNIVFTREINTDDTIIEKTPEEKDQLLADALNAWITAVVSAAGEGVDTYDICSQPLTSASDPSFFDWGEYLGHDSYVARAVAMAREAAGERQLKFFVSQSIDLDATAADKIDRLAEAVSAIEATGVEIEGLNILLHAVYTLDADKQAGYVTALDEMMHRLVATGRKVRISDFTLRITDKAGDDLRATEFYKEERKAELQNVLSESAGFHTLVLKTFRSLLADKAEGFSVGKVYDADACVAPWNANSNRTLVYEGIVNGLGNIN